MALKSKEWFYKNCLQQVKQFGPLTHLCWDILEKGIGQRDSTRGHVTQAIGAAQEFLRENPQFKTTIKQADPTRPFDIVANRDMLRSFRAWLHAQTGEYGRRSFGYSYDTLKGILTQNLGGNRTGGGGGVDEFKRVIRLMPEFV